MLYSLMKAIKFGFFGIITNNKNSTPFLFNNPGITKLKVYKIIKNLIIIK